MSKIPKLVRIFPCQDFFHLWLKWFFFFFLFMFPHIFDSLNFSKATSQLIFTLGFSWLHWRIDTHWLKCFPSGLIYLWIRLPLPHPILQDIRTAKLSFSWCLFQHLQKGWQQSCPWTSQRSKAFGPLQSVEGGHPSPNPACLT